MEGEKMTKEYDHVLEAKKSVRAHIDFFEALLKHLKGPDKVLRNRAVWAAWCLHRYINDKMRGEIQDAMEKNVPKEGDNVQ
jgi:hypothetical protein